MFRFPSPRLAHLRLRLAGSSAAADTFVSPLIPVRHASLTSAIGHGIRKSRGAESSLDRDRRGRQPQQSNHNEDETQTHENKSRSEEFEFDEDEFIRTGNFRALPRRYRGNRESDMKNTKAKEKDQASSEEGQEERPLVRKILVRPYEGPNHDNSNADNNTKDKNNKKTKDKTKTKTKPKQNVKVPASIPYTTPASEFIYGTTAVEAALRCTRRKLYKLYIYQGPEEDELSETKIALQKLALSKGVHAKVVYAGWDRLLDKMSAGRPHNGVILEASPLPKLPITSFEKVEKLDFSSDSNENNIDHFKVQLAPQSREEAAINGTSPIIPMINPTVHQKRYPLTLLLDGILDPGNLGAIIRSAYFLGIDAIAFAGRNSAPLSPVTIKASAGAAENMTLLKVTNNTVEFMKWSQENGWRFYAADAPQPGSETISSSPSGSNSEGETPSFNLLRQAPTVIMLGSEGTGLSPHIRAQADAIVGIPSARRVRGSSVDIGIDSDPARVDSLNVSVAAALLMEMFLRHPLCVSDVPKKTNSKASKKK